jgi:hypothetical protein
MIASDYDQYGYDFDDVYEDEDEDEDIESMKVNERRIMLAEKRVDDDVTSLGGTVLQRKGYNMTDNNATNAEPNDTVSRIDYCNAFLEVIEGDMEDLEDNITKKETDVVKGYRKGFLLEQPTDEPRSFIWGNAPDYDSNLSIRILHQKCHQGSAFIVCLVSTINTYNFRKGVKEASAFW